MKWEIREDRWTVDVNPENEPRLDLIARRTRFTETVIHMTRSEARDLLEQLAQELGVDIVEA